MMAASLVETGSGASAIDSHSLVPSPTHSSSLHDPSPDSTSDAAADTSSIAAGDEDSEDGGVLDSDKNSLFLTGKKLAVSSPPGLSASEDSELPPAGLSASEDSEFLTDQEDPDPKHIALNQLKELDVAIGLRKVNKVDGRKTRWIEYRLQKFQKSLKKPQQYHRKENKRYNDGQMADRIVADLNFVKNIESPEKDKKTEKNPNFKIKQLKEFIRTQSEKADSIGVLQGDDVILNDTNNNSDINISNMKADVVATDTSATPVGPTSVLETMKQHFIEDTNKTIDKSAVSISKTKEKHKLKKNANTLSSLVANGKVKKARGRPKKFNSKSKVPTNHSVSNSDATESHNLSSPVKTEPSTISQSTSDFYSHRKIITKGLRTVRKSESSSESGSSSPIKCTSPSPRMSPSLPLKVSPIPLSPFEPGSYKCPLITAAAKALSYNSKQSLDDKKVWKKNGKKENVTNGANKPLNGHSSLSNGSKKFSDDTSSDNCTSTKDADRSKTLNGKNPRGRPRSNNITALKWSKKTTVIADVHNTMNGEPQMGIPVNNPVVKPRKKRSLSLLSSKPSIDGESDVDTKPNSDPMSNKENSYIPIVPNESSPFKKNQYASASKIDSVAEPCQIDSTKEVCHSSIKVNEVISDEMLDCQNGVSPLDSGLSFKKNKSLETSNSITNSPSESNCSDPGRRSIDSDKSRSLTLLSGIRNSPEFIKKFPDKRQRTILEFTNILEPRSSGFAEPKFQELHASCDNTKPFLLDSSLEDDKPGVSTSDNSRISDVSESYSLKTIKNEVEAKSDDYNGITYPKAKQTPCKTKSKSLTAVIEKLHSPSPKKLTPENEFVSSLKHGNTSIDSIKVETSETSTIPTAQMNPQNKLISSKHSANTKGKVPRFLKQLFQDEGVQNMLRSMNEESSNSEGSTNSDASMHKLRPKRANDPPLSESPEPEEYFSLSQKKRRRIIDSDNNSEDGSQNVSHCLDSLRKSPTNDQISISQSSFKSGQQSSDGKKRKPVDIVSAQNSKVPENKRPRLTAPGEQDVNIGAGNKVLPDSIAKKKGKQNPHVSMKHNSQLQLLKKRMLKLGIKENMSFAQIRELLQKRKAAKSSTGSVANFFSNKDFKKSGDHSMSFPVPPIKIKLSPNSERKDVHDTAANPSISKSGVPSALNSNLTPNPIQPTPSNIVNGEASSEKIPPLESKENSSTKDHKDALSTAPLLQKSVGRPQATMTNGSTQITTLVRPTENSSSNQKGKLRITGEGLRQSQRTCVRQNEGNHFRDIQLRRFNNFIQIILNPSTTKMKNALNSRVLHELCEALSSLRGDDSVRVVLLTATGSTFCQGIDFTSLQHPNQDTRKKNAENLLRGIREFMRALVQFPKLIIAGVNGNAMGLGVTMLPLFDMVFATDKAEFFLPYGNLGQVPEGGATYTFPNFFGKLQSTKLFCGHRITATEALNMGMVSETLWPATFLQELIPKVASLASQAVQGMEATKALMNHHLLTKLELSLESECRILLQQWMSTSFATCSKKFFDTHYIQLQKPVSLPL